MRAGGLTYHLSCGRAVERRKQKSPGPRPCLFLREAHASLASGYPRPLRDLRSADVAPSDPSSPHHVVGDERTRDCLRPPFLLTVV